MNGGGWFLGFGIVCVMLILAPVVLIAFGRIAHWASGERDVLAPPDPSCLRPSERHWKVGSASSGFRDHYRTTAQ